MKGNLILIRGLPGSGKSTKAKEIMKQVPAEHFEADMFFINSDGEYKFIPCNIAEAHEWCRKSTEDALNAGKNVIVSNTFVKMWEMDKYLNMDCASLAIFETVGEYDSIHGVPSDTIKRMKKNWEQLPSCYDDCSNK